ncbi:hypothetical protein Hanom_Chr10g00909921 [Helianthus anomalus]
MVLCCFSKGSKRNRVKNIVFFLVLFLGRQNRTGREGATAREVYLASKTNHLFL